MPLEKSWRRVLGSTVFCTPIEYYGWNISEGSDFRPISPPMPFHAKISELRDHAAELRALVGLIQETGHAFDQRWAAFCIRDSYLNEQAEGKLFFDLASNFGNYNVTIGSHKPQVLIDVSRPMFEWAKIANGPVIHGYGYVSESEVSLEQIMRLLPETRTLHANHSTLDK